MTAAVGIVLYNPDIPRLKLNIESVCRDTECIYLCDNGSENIEEIRTLLKDYRAVLLENGENLGIAAALNILCRYARADGFSHILTLDQDSVCGTGMLKILSLYAEDETIGIAAPNECNEGEQPVDLKSGEQYRVITSGSLTSLAAWEAVGGFDEAMFIDLVDHDFCAALRLFGYKIVMDKNALLYHRLGESLEIRFFMRLFGFLPVRAFKTPLYTHNHSPLRTYYYARNTVYFMKKYKNTDAVDIKTERKVFLRWIVLKLGFEKQKFSKLRAILRGVRDGRKMIAGGKNNAKA